MIRGGQRDRRRRFRTGVIAALLVVGLGAASGRARAEAQPSSAEAAAASTAPITPVAPVAPAGMARGPRFALGASFGFLRQEDLGGSIATRFIPSLVGLAYVSLAPRLYLRPGARLGLSGLWQPAAATDARVEEHGLQGRAEVGLLYDAWVIPAIGVGAGLERRSIDFVAGGNVQDSGALDRTEWLGSLYAQAGLGVPLFHGFTVVEPYVRIHHTFSDDRASSEVGFDITFAR
jgi:hypothetical protein